MSAAQAGRLGGVTAQCTWLGLMNWASWRMQTVVNVGGANAPGYAATYQKLFGEPLSQAPDGSSFVTHWMVCSVAQMHRPRHAALSIHSSRCGAGCCRHSSAAHIRGQQGQRAVTCLHLQPQLMPPPAPP
jgi:hypothetical protein